MLNFNELTFLFQGPYENDVQIDVFKKNLKTINQFIYGCKTIVSTWENTKLKQDDNFILLKNLDPGETYLDVHSKYSCNLQRQIVSTINGLRIVNTKYTVKLRSDLIIINDSIVKYLTNLEEQANNHSSLLTRRCIVSSFTTIDPSMHVKLLHHPCDWIYAGRTQDLLKIWNASDFGSIQKQPEITYLPNHSDQQFFLLRPESYIWGNFISKFSDINFHYRNLLSSKEAIKISNSYLISNLEILSNRKLGLVSSKHSKSLLHSVNMFNAITQNRICKELLLPYQQEISIEDVYLQLIKRIYGLDLFRRRLFQTTKRRLRNLTVYIGNILK